MSRNRIQQEEVVVDWSIVAIGGSIALGGLIAVAATICWLVLTSPPPPEESVATAAPRAPLDHLEAAHNSSAPLILNQAGYEKPREAGAWSVPVTEMLPVRNKPTPRLEAHEPNSVPTLVAEADPPPQGPYQSHSELMRVLNKPHDQVKPARARFGEAELAQQLEKIPALNLTDDTTLKELIGKLNAKQPQQYAEACVRVLALAKRPELHGLPMLEGKDCELSAKEAQNLDDCAAAVKALVPGLDGRLPRVRRTLSDDYLQEFHKHFYAVDHSRVDVALRALVQIVQTENKEYRRKLVGTIGLSQSAKATTALARRAVFDFDAEVREDAVKLLRSRRDDADRYRNELLHNELLNGLRYPWPPVADQAADALVALGDPSVVPALIDLLDLPDPAAPRRNQEQKWVAAELVRINHLRNCLLCHAPYDGKTGQVRGAIPTPTFPLPVVYYDDRKAPSVRADITYLRQDFSIKMKDPNCGKWPELQRYDFVVRQRQLTDDEVNSRERDRPSFVDYPQREAVLHALRGLTGFDAGQDSADWRRLLKR